MFRHAIISTALIAAAVLASHGCGDGLAPQPTPAPPQPTPSPTPTWSTEAPVTDIDGNVYRTVRIGSQVWTAQDLRTTRYNDGEAIPYLTSVISSIAVVPPGYCWYHNNTTETAGYGALYNWWAISTGKLAPTGWHVATDAEWTTLTNSLGGEAVAGGKLKETGLSHWSSPNTGATNEVGFTSIPAGVRMDTGEFGLRGEHAYYFTASSFDAYTAWGRHLSSAGQNVARYNMGKNDAFAVRCVRND